MFVNFFDWGTGLSFQAPVNLFGYILLAVYLGLSFAFLFQQRRSFQLSGQQWWVFGGLLVAGLGLAQFLILRFPTNILPPPDVPAEPPTPGLSVFALVPALLAGGWLGAGPAFIVGLVIGAARAGWETHMLLTPFEYALLSGASAWCLQQDYRGWPARVVRHPLVVSALIGFLFWPFLYLAYQSYTPISGLIGWDYIASVVAAAAPVSIGQWLVAGLVAELARWGLRAGWPVRRGSQPPPYLSSLNRKLLFTLIPLFTLGIGLLFWADLSVAIRVSTDLAVEQMENSALDVGQGIPFFIQSGRSLASQIAQQEDLLAASPLDQAVRLAQDMQPPFFRQLALYDSDLKLMAAYPEADLALTLDLEALAHIVLGGVAQDQVVYPEEAGHSVEVWFMAPVRDVATRQTVVAVLVGVAELQASPFMQSIAGNLAGVAGGEGQGFIVDSAWRIIYPTPLQSPLPVFAPEPEATPLTTKLSNPNIGGRAYQDKAPDGTRRLVLYYPVPGHDWSVIITVPYHWVLTIATRISQPIIIILLAIGVIGLMAVSLVATQITRPAEALALAAQRISEGRLDLPVTVGGEDEVGRAGMAFERMRQKLRARLDELSLLLRVSQGVASYLNLAQALPPILEGALTATEAAGVRIVLTPSENGNAGALALGAPAAAEQPYWAGEAAPLMAPLDAGIMHLTRTEGRLVIENLARARAVLDVAPVAGKLHALIALPLRQETTYYGMLWLGYTTPHTFSETEINFLTTLASQAAIAVANARLFEAAEQGRQRLAAILASTPDAVIVTDSAERILLLNPAAEKAFGVKSQTGVGQAVAQVLSDPNLIKLFTENRATSNSGEIELGTKTLAASASTIISDDGSVLGRVCVLRDVTHFKEVDVMKSEFVATVSHDLRAPLTFMRGYATMLPMVGSLNDKQREFTEKIIVGIEQMTDLIDDLLDLGRIEAGIGLARQACRMDMLVHSALDALRPHAINKSITLTIEMTPPAPVVTGDSTLLRQAISNYIDNAIKYTPAHGNVSVKATADDTVFTLAVTDTGVGIAPADQTRLFEKFFRVKQRGSTQVKGSGLGLAIVKSIVERHGGRVWVSSKLGQGSTFYMVVPQQPPSAPAPGSE